MSTPSSTPDTRLAIGVGGPLAELDASLDAVVRILHERTTASGPARIE